MLRNCVLKTMQNCMGIGMGNYMGKYIAYVP